MIIMIIMIIMILFILFTLFILFVFFVLFALFISYGRFIQTDEQRTVRIQSEEAREKKSEQASK